MRNYKRLMSLLLVSLIIISNNKIISVYAYEKDQVNTLSSKKELNKVYDENVNRAVDVTPPILHINTLKVDKKEAKVGETVNISLKATDDLSGIKRVEVYYNTPITNKFELVKLSYDEKEDLYKGNIYINENIEEGEWKINYIALTDHLNNYISYHKNRNDFTALTFNVKNDKEIDVTAPILHMDTLNVDKKEADIGDTVNISFKATDDLSGIRSIKVYYSTPITQKMRLVQVYYDEIENLYKGSIYIDENSEEGQWKINYIALTDTMSNYVSYHSSRNDFAALAFNVKNDREVDVTPPIIYMDTLNVDKKEANIGDTVNISFKATDDLSGISSIKVYYSTPITQKMELVQVYYDENDNLYKGSIYLHENSETGEWKINYIALTDTINNFISYYNKNNEFNDLSFNVVEDTNETAPIDNTTVVTKNETWSNKTVEGDVYVGPNTVLIINGNVNISGNVYVLGALKTYGGLNIQGSLNGRSMSFGGNPTLYNGTVVVSGSNSINSTTMKDYPVEDIPIRIDNISLSQEKGKVNIQGATLDISDMYVEDEKVTLDYKGRFDLKDINIGNKSSITVKFITVFGNVITKKISISNDKEDINQDGVVDMLDIALLSENYNKTNNESGWNIKLDINNDGIIDIYDLVLVARKLLT
ncbi:dockerin type I domain-containing protein [Clostridium sp. LP20]|uniref:dockerin type I domain-containing protein n=1 Tax=Clostridium sp. LP20 TaxID=3418665 RepID=UPI003EE5D977